MIQHEARCEVLMKSLHVPSAWKGLCFSPSNVFLLGEFLLLSQDSRYVSYALMTEVDSEHTHYKSGSLSAARPTSNLLSPHAFLAALLPLLCMVGRQSVCPSIQAEAPGGWGLRFLSASYPPPPSSSLQPDMGHILEAMLNSCHGVGDGPQSLSKPLSCGRTSKSRRAGEREQVIQRCLPPWTWKLWSSWGCMGTLCYGASFLISCL